MSKAQPNDTEILEAIRASGYLMEQEVATTLESLRFHVETNRAFEDIDESKSREIDVWAYYLVHSNETTKFQVSVELLCECKNNSNPFVFITRPKNKKDKTYFSPPEFLFPIQKYEKELTRFPDGRPQSWSIVPAFQFLNLAEHHYYYSQHTKAVQFCKIVRSGKAWEANHGGIYDAIFYPLVKALRSRQQEASHLYKREPKPDEWKHIGLFFPMVVLNGEIFSIDSTSHDPQPVSVSDISFSRELKSKSINGRFTVDFVRMDRLKDFIESKVMPFAQYVISLVESSPELFTTKRVG